MRRLAPLAAGLGALLAAAPGCSDDDPPAGTVTPGTDVLLDVGSDGTTSGDATGPDAVAPDSGTTDTGGGGGEGTPGVYPDVETVLAMDAVTLSNGWSETLQFVVPEGAVSVAIVVTNADGALGNYYTVGSWRQPDGSALAYEGWPGIEPQLCIGCTNRISGVNEDVHASIAPNNPSAEVVAGTHSIQIYGSVITGGGIFGGAPEPIDSATVDVTVLVKTLPQLPATGVLDLNLHFTGAQGWTAATAQDNADFQNVMESVRAIYASAGIEIGELTYRDIDSAYQVIESVRGADSDLFEMFAESEGNSTNALNLFFVDELNDDSPLGAFGVILGIAGGIPGPMHVQGSRQSGVAITIKPVPNVPAGIDTTTAHEMGHFLGLFHTSEQDLSFLGQPQIHDPLPDTPDNDESFLMFNSGSGNKLSPWQGRVMRSNPWVRHPEGN